MVSITSEGIATGNPACPYLARIRYGQTVHKEWPAPTLEQAQREADGWLIDLARRAGVPEDEVERMETAKLCTLAAQ